MPIAIVTNWSLEALLHPAAPSPLVVMVHQLLLAVAGVALAHAAHYLWRWRSLGAYRRLRLVGAIQTATALLRIAATAVAFTAGPILIAAQSLVDVGVLVSISAALRSAAHKGELRRCHALIVGGFGVAGLFFAFVGENATVTLFGRNQAAATCQVAALTIGATILIQTLLRLLHTERKAQRARSDRVSAERHRLDDSLKRTATHATELEEGLAKQQTVNGELRRRTRTLEQILTVSARINSTRGIAELMERVVGATEEILGFKRVVLYLYSESIQAFQARAFAGVDEQEQARLSGHQVTVEEYRHLTDARHRYSNCFLVSRTDASTELGEVGNGAPPPWTPGASGPWHDDYLLVAPLVTASGEKHGYLSVAAPVDGQVPSPVEIRQLEFLVRQATTALDSVEVYGRLARKNTELATASEKLQSLSEMKANFVANVSHELRTPLTSISAYTELLQRDTEGMSDDVRNEFLRVINQESDKLTGIIDDILELSRMEDGKVRLDMVRTDLGNLVDRLRDSWRLRASHGEIDFKIDIRGEDFVLEADPLLLQQLLDHLLSNAFKFTPEGGRVRLDIEECGTAVRVTVEDNGIGIPAEQLDAIFEQFYQVDGSSTRQHNGQGVGLALCHDIVGYHDGRIWAENVEPSGARFNVLLPRRPAVLQPVTTHRPASNLQDSNQFMQRVMHWISESLGVQMATLMVPDPAREFLTIRAAIGLPEAVVQSASVRQGAGFAGKAWVTGRSLLIEDIVHDERFRLEENDIRYTTPSVLCVPLAHDLDIIGVVTVNNRFDGRPLGDDDRRLLEALAPRITYLLSKHSEHEAAGREFSSIQEALRATTTVGHLDHEHVTAVCHEICLATARHIGLGEEELEHLAFALQYYDVGMSTVPAHLLHKTDALADQERREIAKHVPASLLILAPLMPPAKVRQIIHHHHENYDGSGYPEGIVGEAIPLGARLLRLTDSLTASLQRRAYRGAQSVDDSLEEIRSGKGRRYCPRLTEVFLKETEARCERLERVTVPCRDAVDLERPPVRLPVPTTESRG